MSAKYVFTIPIGDWSGDGHGSCNWYYIESNKDIKKVREAYFKAKEILPKEICPENICSTYDDANISAEAINLLNKYGFNRNIKGIYPALMLNIVLWFIEQGDSEIILNEIEVPTLPFYGYDEKRRHIGHIGYGLFE